MTHLLTTSNQEMLAYLKRTRCINYKNKNYDFLPHPQNGEVHPRVGPNTELSASELMTLSCGVIFKHIKNAIMNLWKGGICWIKTFRNNDSKVLFFLAFFVAMYVEVKAENTIYQVFCTEYLRGSALLSCQRNSAMLNTLVLEQKIKSENFF